MEMMKSTTGVNDCCSVGLGEIALLSGDAELGVTSRAAAGGVRSGEIVLGLERPFLITVFSDRSAGRAKAKRYMAGRVQHAEVKHFELHDKVLCKEVFVRCVMSVEFPGDAWTT